jgi:hypothetical protein
LVFGNFRSQLANQNKWAKKWEQQKGSDCKKQNYSEMSPMVVMVDMVFPYPAQNQIPENRRKDTYQPGKQQVIWGKNDSVQNPFHQDKDANILEE